MSGYPGYRRGRGRRRGIIAIVTLLVVVVLLVLADRVAAAYAESRMASQIQSQGGLSSKPHVTIEGFPFLTQVVSHDLQDVKISAHGERAGPVTITQVNATLHHVHLNSGFTGGTVSQVNGTAFIGFGSLTNAADVPGLKVSAAGPDTVKLSVDLAIVSGSATARVTLDGDRLRVRVISASGIPLSALGGLGNTTLTIPRLPLGMSVQSLSVSAQGIRVSIAGQNVSFSS